MSINPGPPATFLIFSPSDVSPRHRPPPRGTLATLRESRCKIDAPFFDRFVPLHLHHHRSDGCVFAPVSTLKRERKLRIMSENLEWFIIWNEMERNIKVKFVIYNYIYINLNKLFQQTSDNSSLQNFPITCILTLEFEKNYYINFHRI